MDLSKIFQIQPNTEVAAFLASSQLNKILISQSTQSCEIFLSCPEIPTIKLYQECQKFFEENLTQASSVELKLHLLETLPVEEFIQKYSQFLQEILILQKSSLQGWLYNSVWQMETDEATLRIGLNSEFGVQYLLKAQFPQIVQQLIRELNGTPVMVHLVYDKDIPQPELMNLKPATRVEVYQAPKPVQSAPPTVTKVSEQEKNPDLLMGKWIKEPARAINEVGEDEKYAVIEGRIFGIEEERKLKNEKYLFSFKVTDEKDSMTCKVIKELDEVKALKKSLKDVEAVKVKGSVRYDNYARELTMMAFDVNFAQRKKRTDLSEDKRVELHLHTNMSANDALASVEDLVNLAADMGHEAIAITDHGVVQSFPEAHIIGKKRGIKIIYGLEGYIFDDDLDKSKQKTYHCVILAKNMKGLKALYQLVTESNLNFFYRRPRIPKRLLQAVRENLIIGSACEAGELIQKYLETNNNHEEVVKIAEFYDYLEVQPHLNNEFMIRKGIVNSEDDLKQINLDIYKLGKELGKPVVATGDVHFANKDDQIYRAIMMAGKKYDDADLQPPLYYRNTSEMLAEFNYFDEEAAREIVITNPKMVIADIEECLPVPKGLHPPEIEGAEDEIRSLTYNKAHELYGESLPTIVENRINKELTSIIGNGFSVLYLIAHKLVKKSNDDGYYVGSRGSVGSSLVAHLTGITEVNALAPHYRCPHCFWSEFYEDGSYDDGADMPDRKCPECGTVLIKDGHDIPFEVFLGFKGDKVPDIDLNFSGVYQPRAHAYTEELFGKDNVFRAGTYQTFAEKTALGYVHNYLEERSLVKRSAEKERLALGFTGVRRTTGQHPGGQMVIPKGVDVHDFTPLAIPADDPGKGTVTTHFTYEQIHDRLVKLDILGHDNPTIIRMLEDLTGVKATTIPLDEQKVLSLFTSTEALGVTPEEIDSPVATYGIPEFGTKFVRQMLVDAKPKKFSDLVRISGFSHGTDVWLNNAKDLIGNGVATVSQLIACRDDIMITLIHNGLDESRAFKIMESVRKGKGLTPDDEAYMNEKEVPSWYIGSCKKIKYLFPKAHAVAYVMMAFRIAYYKVYHPLAFYAAAFSVKTDDFDADIICKGIDAVRAEMERIKAAGNEASEKDKKFTIVLELALEMYSRGLEMTKVDLEKSKALEFDVIDNKLIPPFAALQGLGQSVAESIVEARNKAPFKSVEDLGNRAKIGSAILETLRNHGVLEGLPESDQLELF